MGNNSEREELAKLQRAIGPAEPKSPCVDCSKFRRELESTYALDQLTLLAEQETQREFVLSMAAIFGNDIPTSTYLRLQEALCVKAIQNPRHLVVEYGVSSACYDDDNRTICIDKHIVDKAIKKEDASWRLLTILLNEFGEHINHILRHDLAEQQATAEAEESSINRVSDYRVAIIDVQNTGETEYAQYRSPEYTGLMKVTYWEIHQAAKSETERATEAS
jgi:hypothetical protein